MSKKNFGDFLSEQLAKAKADTEHSHRHLDEFLASLKTETKLAQDAGVCTTCLVGAATLFLVDLMIDTNSAILSPEGLVEKIPALAEDLSTKMFARIFERAIDARAKAFVGALAGM